MKQLPHVLILPHNISMSLHHISKSPSHIMHKPHYKTAMAFHTKPILLYGCEIWGYCNLDIIERVHLKFCKLLLNLKKSTPNYMIYGELGILPMSVFIKSRTVNFWIRTLDGKENKLSCILYKSLYHKYENNNVNSPWIKGTRTNPLKISPLSKLFSIV